MPWSATPQPQRFSEPGTPCGWSSKGGHSTHLHHTRHVSGRRGPFSSTSSLDPPTAAEPAMRDHQAVSRPGSTSQRCCMYMVRARQCAWTGLPANHASERSLHRHLLFFPHKQKIRPAAKKKRPALFSFLFFSSVGPKRKKSESEAGGRRNHPSRRPTHNHPQASPRPTDPKCPLPQSCTTTACAYRVSHQSQKGQTSAPPAPH